MSNSKGIPYYFNALTKKSSWDAPLDLSEDQIKSLPGSHYLSSGSSGGAGTITASHLLVKHKDSRRPSSWKEVCMHLPSIKGHTLTLYAPRQILHALRKKLLTFSEDIRLRLATRAKSSKNWRVCIPIVRRIPKRETSDHSRRVRCKSRLKTLRLLCRLESSAISSAQTAVCTSF
jgi:hypothetical protein